MQKNLLTLPLITITLLTGCGMSEEERQRVAAETCAVVAATNVMQGSIRVKELIEARRALGEEEYRGGDEGIAEAIQLGICEALVLNDSYDDKRITAKDAFDARIAEQKRLKEEKVRLSLKKVSDFRDGAQVSKGSFDLRCESERFGVRFRTFDFGSAVAYTLAKKLDGSIQRDDPAKIDSTRVNRAGDEVNVMTGGWVSQTFLLESAIPKYDYQIPVLTEVKIGSTYRSNPAETCYLGTIRNREIERFDDLIFEV